jgi:cytochrome c oxidase subunit II
MGIINKLLGIGKVYSEHGVMVDYMLEAVHWFMLILFIFWTTFLLIAWYRFHQSNNPKASHSGITNHASTHLEIGVIVVELVLLLGFAFPLWGQRTSEMPAAPDVQVRAIAAQFNWNFHYTGADGKFGNTNPYYYAGNNPAGIDPDDPNGKDDIVASMLSLPVGKSVVIGVTSRDVIHNLALVGARMATDANPGQLNRVWFKPTKTGKSEIICGQLCGSQHGVMKGDMEILDEKDFAAWLGEQNTFGSTLAKPAVAAN